MSSIPIQRPAPTPPAESPAEKFRRLATTWRDETAYVSSSTQMFAHPAYQEIIRMGEPVVPLLLQDLEQDPDHWFHALRVITGANPVSAEESGNLDKMTAAWLRWGREHGYR